MAESLTPRMKRALLQIGYGVFGREGGFYDEGGERLDLRSANALCRRGWVMYYTIGGAPVSGRLDLTDEGWRMFEECQPR
ncbi:MAG: hypothetical protein A2W25_12030 [candidate division Zixibacteria bacterium RBG_16_53_22]|nr:MAG: hypothetical protein A2W25_12030 [candidate division Zixibacteria bacterium RBG_16_53_22]